MTEGSVITFYSYKGGVGRSFLLANVAATLSRWGFRVLCVDFDLEAPGLMHYFDGWALPQAAAATDNGNDQPAGSSPTLTQGERDVLVLTKDGLSNKEIAIRLGLSEGTVKTRMAAVFRKLNVANRAEAVLAASATTSDLSASVESNAVEAPIVSANAGLLELVEAFDRGESLDYEAFVVHLALPAPHTPIAILPAGRRDDTYMTRVQRLDWERLYARRNLGAAIETLRQDWTSKFDFVLVDSRTGVSDTGGICTAQLPDLLVLVFAPNRQNLDGILEVAAKSAVRRNELPYDRQGLVTIPILSRLDQRAERELAREWLKVVEERLAPLLRSWLHRDVTPAQFFERVLVPYYSAWSFGEDVPAAEAEEHSGPEEITYYVDTIAALLTARGAGTEQLVVNRDSYVDAARIRIPGVRAPDYDVYLSYSLVDAEFARRLAAILEDAGFHVFFDEAAVQGGPVQAGSVSRALKTAAAMVALIGRATARWQVENIRMFLGGSRVEARPVIPVVLQGADEPDIPRFLRQYKEVSAFDRDVAEVGKQIADMLRAYQASGDASPA